MEEIEAGFLQVRFCFRFSGDQENKLNFILSGFNIFLLPVVPGRHPGVFLKQIAEIMGVIISDLFRDLIGVQFSPAEQFFCLLQPKPG